MRKKKKPTTFLVTVSRAVCPAALLPATIPERMHRCRPALLPLPLPLLLLLLLLLLQAVSNARATVIVYGSTPAAIAAAVGAARTSTTATGTTASATDVVLADPSPRVGGMVSGGLCATDEGIPAAIGGVGLEFFRRVGKAYNRSATAPLFRFEPHVAEAVFLEMLLEANVKYVASGVVTQATVRDGQIASFATASGLEFSGPNAVFIDASYDGDLVRAAGVSYTWGREPGSLYNESWAGRVEPFSDTFDFHNISPLDDRGNLLPLLTNRLAAPLHSGDFLAQGYNFRLCVTQQADNRISFPAPRTYNASQWELLRRFVNITSPDFTRFAGPVPLYVAGKYDLNNGALVSTDATGLSWGYPNASTYEKRAAIADAHREYMLQFFYFLGNDPDIPAALRASTATWGLCKDEFTSNGGWPEQLYVRETIRVVGDRVLKQSDLWSEEEEKEEEEELLPADGRAGKDSQSRQGRRVRVAGRNNIKDSIGLGSYPADGHYVTRGPCVVSADRTTCKMATTEDQLQAALRAGTLWTGGEGYPGATNAAVLYQIPYYTLLPKRAQAANLLVPVTPSASHVTFASLRVEPQFMILGHAAGVAAALAVSLGCAVQDVPIASLQSTLIQQGAVISAPPAA
jgi:hypothetical protein